MNLVYTRSSTIYDESRATKEIMAFLEAGFSVYVLGWDRNGLAYDKCKDVFNEYVDKIQFKFYSGNIGTSVISKMLSRYKWNLWLNKELGSISQIDIIHACDYDTGATVRKYAHKNKKKYVYDIFDYYIDAHPVPRVIRWVIEKDEIKTINCAEVTIICTEERKEQIKKAKPKEIVIIYNSPDVEAFEQIEEKYDYVYCGGLYNMRLIEEILELYPKNTQYKFVFAGSGDYSNKAEQLAKEYENFSYLGPIAYSKVLEVERASKVISAIYEPTIRNHQLCAPNKFYEALALAKPIIVCHGTGIDNIVDSEHIGSTISYDAEEFYEALNELLLNDDDRKLMGKKGRKLYESKYKWNLMKKRLIEVYDKIYQE